ncbi:hypothetical protein H0H93_002306, partial [Arthromyces matolae]
CRASASTSVASAHPTASAKPTVDNHAAAANTTTTTVKSTKTSSSATSAPTTTKALVTTGKLASIFPVSGYSKSWSTSSLISNPLPLSDSTFRPTKAISTLTHSYVNAPDGKLSMRAIYPKGSYTFTNEPQGGFSFYAPGPTSVDLTTAKEATFGYSVYFEEGFDFNKGGKLPGLYGGDSAEEAVSCSGGRRDPGCNSVRLMFRTDGAGELYTYLPDYTNPLFAANEVQCKVAPYSECNPTYGASVGRGAFKFATGARTFVSQRVRLNDAGKANGEIELFVNGKSVINVSGLIIRDSSAGRIWGIQMQTFFGGHTSDYASPKTQDAYFSDFSVAITETL